MIELRFRFDATDRAWARTEPPLPVSSRGRRWRDHRQVLNGILWKLRIPPLKIGKPGELMQLALDAQVRPQRSAGTIRRTSTRTMARNRGS